MPKGLWGRRLVSQPQWIAQLLDPFGHDRTPAENPNRNSPGAVAFQNAYSPPTYGEDIAASGVPRAPLSGVLAPPEVEPETMGMGGPLVSLARNIIPNAPQGPSQQELDAIAAREAIARAHGDRGGGPLSYNENPRWFEERRDLERLQERAATDQAEMARRAGVSFEDFWRYGGRQSEEWTPDQPAYRFSRLPEEQREPRRGPFAGWRR